MAFCKANQRRRPAATRNKESACGIYVIDRDRLAYWRAINNQVLKAGSVMATVFRLLEARRAKLNQEKAMPPGAEICGP